MGKGIKKYLLIINFPQFCPILPILLVNCHSLLVEQ